MSGATAQWMRYRGDGSTPTGQAAQTRGEQGRYLADARLVTAVNTALAVKQPILVTGEPGTGKTMLAWSIASELGLGKVLEFHTRSDNQAHDVLYDIDYLTRFYHAQTGDPRAQDLKSYVDYRPLGEAIKGDAERVVLIDEIDKAPRDFPNDLLDELDTMEFEVHELKERYKATARPIVVITSNSERQLPDPFLRRCIFHRLDFPTGDRLQAILRERLGYLGVEDKLIAAASNRFQQLRLIPGFEKLPSTAELISWTKVLHVSGIDADTLQKSPLSQLPFPGALVKSEQDSTLLGRQLS